MITVTGDAVLKLKGLLELEEEGGAGLALRVGVRPGGCSGFVYDVFFDGKVDRLQDWVGEFDGLKVVVDPESAPYLLGSELYWNNDLTNGGLKISNPGESRSCGCGKSFS